jgi:hypothetical protein
MFLTGECEIRWVTGLLLGGMAGSVRLVGGEVRGLWLVGVVGRVLPWVPAGESGWPGM